MYTHHIKHPPVPTKADKKRESAKHEQELEERHRIAPLCQNNLANTVETYTATHDLKKRIHVA